MNLEQATAAVDAISAAFPESRKVSSGYVVSQSELHTLFLGIAWENDFREHHVMVVQRYLPLVSGLVLNRKNLAKISKMDKKFCRPKLFKLRYRVEDSGEIQFYVSLGTTVVFGVEEFMDLDAISAMLCILIFRGLGELMSNSFSMQN